MAHIANQYISVPAMSAQSEFDNLFLTSSNKIRRGPNGM